MKSNKKITIVPIINFNILWLFLISDNVIYIHCHDIKIRHKKNYDFDIVSFKNLDISDQVKKKKIFEIDLNIILEELGGESLEKLIGNSFDVFNSYYFLNNLKKSFSSKDTSNLYNIDFITKYMKKIERIEKLNKYLTE